MKTVDTRGQLCPAPLIETRRALKEVQSGEFFKVLIDNMTSFKNVTRFLTDNGIDYKASEADGVWTLVVSGKDGALLKSEVKEYCEPDIPHFNKGNFVVAVGSDKMGDGDQVLGELLITNFFKALKDLDVLPSKIVFYNKGILLGIDNSPVIEHLKELQTMGVSLFLCGTCINHYKAGDNIHIGTISNMFEIAQIMASASNVIKP